MANVTVTYAKLAEAALSLTAAANVPATDESLAMAQAVRQFLRGIATGQLVIAQAQTEKNVSETPTPEPRPKRHNARHADGVVPPALAAKLSNGHAPPRGADGVIAESISGAPRT